MTANPSRLIEYPCSDGKPMSDNTKQARWIFTLFGGLLAEFRHRDDVFVAADNLWYPVEGEPSIRVAPDVYVVFGRPKGDRLSYLQWEENDIPLTVVFEVLSPSNTTQEMDEKLLFYDEYGVEEYYCYDPDNDELKVWIRGRATLSRVYFQESFTSPRLGIRFDLTGPEMRVFQSNGDPFLTYDQLKTLQEQERVRAEAQRQRAEQAERLAAEERQRAAEAQRLADEERQRAAEAQRLAAEQRQRAEEERLRAEEQRQRAADAQRLADEERQRAAEAQRLADEEQRRASQLQRELSESLQRLENSQALAEAAQAAAQTLQARLHLYRQLSRLARAGTATPEQLAQLEQLEAELAGQDE
jgi:Uma2 family endonuclease